MSRQIIIKEGTEIAVWSTIVDDFVFEGNIKDYAKQVADTAEENTLQTFLILQRGGKPYHQFQMTYEEACAVRDELKETSKC